MNRRGFLASSLALSIISWIPSWAKAFFGRHGVTRIAFSACAVQTDPQPIWNAISKVSPDVFVFLGDNVYNDTDDVKWMADQYQLLENLEPFRNFRSRFPVVGTWDDHDMGRNDAGAEYPFKRESKDLLMDFLREPANSERRAREGVYTSYVWGERSRRVQLILLDLRWFRTELKKNEDDEYIPTDDPNAVLLGEEQWAWLGEQLKVPADVRFIGSSIQFASSEHRWEKWANFPHEKERLIRLLDAKKITNAIVLSGDMHFGEISVETTPAGTKIYDFTSSAMNFTEAADELPNSKRLHFEDRFANFGLVSLDWPKRRAKLELKSERGKTLFSRTISF